MHAVVFCVSGPQNGRTEACSGVFSQSENRKKWAP
jgi:hypothetical protein